ncbi:MAG: hypothetical protein PWP58_1546 [Bacillota bacterium]|nr:hypothetical protein [Bacillota bacterium]
MLKVTLTIHTEPALIGIESKKARAPVAGGLAPFLVTISHPRLALQSEEARIVLDARAARTYAGLAGYRELTRLVAEQSYQDVLAAIEETAAEGDRLAAFWVPGNTIPDVAAERPYPRPPFSYGAPPVHPVRVTVIPGGVRAEFTPGRVRAELGEKPPGSPYEPGMIRVYLRQYPKIEIEAQVLDERA